MSYPVRWFFVAPNYRGFPVLGNSDGYSTKAQCINENKFYVNEALRGDRVVYIYKAVVNQVIRKK